ncbi:MAG: alpha/beta hydrolase [Pseudomonadota bacterium]
MNPRTEALVVAGPAGALQCAVDRPDGTSPPRGVAVLCHPHPLHGGTMDNKVVITLARVFVQLGHVAVRFNFRGVGTSQGSWDEGRGEIDDALAVIAATRAPGLPLVLGGFSFGGYVASHAAACLASSAAHAGAARVVLIAPAARSFPLADVPAGTLVVHGEHDEVVPLSAVLDWARPRAQPVTLVPGAGDFFHGPLTLLKQIVLAAWGVAPGAAAPLHP